MKKIFTLLLVTLLSSVAALADEVTYDFTSAIPAAWKCNVTPQGFEAANLARGTQFNSAQGTVTLTLAGVKNVDKVVVNCSSNLADKNTVAVAVGSTTFGSVTLAKENNVDKTFSGTATDGDLTITITPAEKSVWVKKVVVYGEAPESGSGEGGDESGTATLDPDYTYTEPTVIYPTGETSYNAPYSFVQKNVEVKVSTGAQAPTYFGCNAGQNITFTAAKPIKGIVINGYVKMDFEAEVDNGFIDYVDASEGEVEDDPVVVITDIDATSVTITCTKQLRCYEVGLYFDENPDVEIGGYDDEDYTYDWEPTEAKNFDINFTQAEYMDYGQLLEMMFGFYAPITYISLCNPSYDYGIDLLANSQTVSGTILAPGVYDIDFSGDDDTIMASEGGTSDDDDPAMLMTDFEYDEEYEEWYYNTVYYIVSGTLTVAEDPAGVRLTLDAKTYNGSTIKATFAGEAVDLLGEEEEGIRPVFTPDAAPTSRKSTADGAIVIRHGGHTYTVAGLRRR